MQTARCRYEQGRKRLEAGEGKAKRSRREVRLNPFHGHKQRRNMPNRWNRPACPLGNRIGNRNRKDPMHCHHGTRS